MKQLSKSKNSERGSALLIVFVFAATIAIMLFMEMPVAVFEAQRNKEQLLIDRGNEYARGVKLFLRKTGQYPPSLDALENTNRMRYLRKRYKDPFTGKDDWRLLHAGPNGILIDSKVNPISNVTGAGNSNLNGNNSNNQSANNSPFGGSNPGSAFGASNSNSSRSGFGSFNSPSSSNAGFGGFNASSSSATSTAEVVVPNIPQRPPAIAANGATGQDANGSSAQDMPVSAVPGSQNNASQTASDGQVLGPNGPPVSPNTLGGQTANHNGTQPPQIPGTNPAAAARPGASGVASSPFGAPSSSSSGMGVIQSGGIAGVASKAEGHAIKTVNDQENYSLWEFYYDPTKDAMRNAAGALAQMGGQRGISQSNSTTPASGTTPSSGGFGNFGSGLSGMQNNSSNGFSQGGRNTNSGFGNSGFGGSNTPSSPPPTTSSTVPTNGPPQ